MPSSRPIAEPGRYRCAIERSSQARRPARRGACRTPLETWLGPPSGRGLVRPCQLHAWRGGFGPGRAALGRYGNLLPHPPGDSTWGPGRRGRQSPSVHADPGIRKPASAVGSPDLAYHAAREPSTAGDVWPIGGGFAHDNEDLAALVSGATDPPLAAVDDIIVAVPPDHRCNVGGV